MLNLAFYQELINVSVSCAIPSFGDEDFETWGDVYMCELFVLKLWRKL